MKKTVASFLFLLVAVSAFGQDGKPTKEQTIDFIKTNYPRELGYLAAKPDGDSGRITFNGEITDIKMNITGTKVTVSYQDVLKCSIISREFTAEGVERSREQHLITFDLKEIEAIQGSTRHFVGDFDYESAEDGIFPMNLVFFAAGGKPLVSVTTDGETRQVNFAVVPFTWDEVGDNHQVHREFTNSQLYKAFQHLRKLSGAPEPIRF